MSDTVFSANLPHDFHATMRMVADRLEKEPGFAESLDTLLADQGGECDAHPADPNPNHNRIPEVTVMDEGDLIAVVLGGDCAQVVQTAAGLSNVSVAMGIWLAIQLYGAATQVRVTKEDAGKAA